MAAVGFETQGVERNTIVILRILSQRSQSVVAGAIPHKLKDLGANNPLAALTASGLS